MSDKNNESYVVNSFHNYGIKALGKELASICTQKISILNALSIKVENTWFDVARKTFTV